MSLKIIFMGTPDFAVPCLEQIISDGYTVSGVFCQPDRPKGRGYKLAAPPVKELALRHDIPVFQPVKLRDGSALSILKSLDPDLIVVVAYGRILPADILALPRLGCVNVHASLLPKLRGAAPIQWSVINGDINTGVTTMFMAEGMDTGDIILTEETRIGETETAGELFGRLSLIGARCLSKTIPLLVAGTAPRMVQDETNSTYAPMIDKSTGYIDFTKTTREICCLARGLNPSPSAYTYLDGTLLKIHNAVAVSGFFGKCGELLDHKRFIVGCKDGAVELLTVQPEGKKPMDGTAFIPGRRLQKGHMLGGKQ